MIAYFKMKFIVGLQYRASAFAAILTQIFFGIVYISVYLACYESGTTSNLPMPLNELVSYLWLNQIFFALVYLWYKDNDILNLIKTGNISYELCRPQDLYNMWFSKILGERLSSVTLRFPLVLILALLLPNPYNLAIDLNLTKIIVFLITFILGIFLMVSFTMFYHTICLITLDEKGIVNIIMVLADILSGLTLPIPFFPLFLRNICNILPFRYISDLSFRLLVGNIAIKEGLIGIIIQIIWIIIFIIAGRLIVKKSLKKVVLQGG